MVHIDLPQEIEERLRRECGDLDSLAREAMGVELYRQGRLTHVQLSRLLELSRYDTDGVLKRHGVYYNLTATDVLRDAEISQQARGS